MSIKKETLLSMAAALKIDTAAFTAALDAETEQDFTFSTDDLSILTKAEQASREDQLKSRHEKAGGEIAIKNLKEKTGLEFEGKSQETFIEKFKEKVLGEANITESEKVKELNATIGKLQDNVHKLTQEKEISAQQALQGMRDAELLTMTIDLKPDHISNEMWLTMVKLENELAEDNGVKVVKRKGEIVRNNDGDLKPIEPKEALKSWIAEKKIGKAEQQQQQRKSGRDGEDSRSSHTGIANMKQFKEHLKTEGINANGQKAQQMLQEITTANPNFDFSES
jgi:hypothetical protein